MMSLIEQFTADIRQRMRLMVGRAILSVVNDGGTIQTAQAACLADETHDDVERIQEYGFTSVPLPGAEAVIVFVGGQRDHGLIIAVDDRRYRLKAMAGGEVALYDDQGQKVHIKRTGIEVSALNILLKSPGVIRIEGDKVEIHGNTYVQTDVNGKGTREAWTGGVAWTISNYITGANVTNNTLGITPPKTPSTPGVL